MMFMSTFYPRSIATYLKDRGFTAYLINHRCVDYRRSWESLCIMRYPKHWEIYHSDVYTNRVDFFTASDEPTAVAKIIHKIYKRRA
jgi:hypothetical protein